jgi:hypothetical protein
MAQASAPMRPHHNQVGGFAPGRLDNLFERAADRDSPLDA